MALHPCRSLLCYSYWSEITKGDDLGDAVLLLRELKGQVVR